MSDFQERPTTVDPQRYVLRGLHDASLSGTIAMIDRGKKFTQAALFFTALILGDACHDFAAPHGRKDVCMRGFARVAE